VPAPDPYFRCSILELTETMTRCAWPVGDPKKPLEPIFCGTKKEADNLPYCPYHASIACRKRGESERDAAERDAKEERERQNKLLIEHSAA
jgi:hypothetical protein